MKSIKILILLCCMASHLFAQGISNNWLLGYLPAPLISGTSAKGKVDFYNGSAITSVISTKMKFNKTQGNISDASGNLLMSSNGIFIANATGDTMLNGAGLNPDPYVIANNQLTGLNIPHTILFLK